MSANCPNPVIPSLVYRDAHAAIDFLERAFGFTRKVVYDNPDGTVGHAELTLNGGMLMLGTVRPDGPNAPYMVQPDEIGDRSTGGLYLVVADCDAVFEATQKAGGKILRPVETMSYGGKAFACMDPEGHLWGIGEYDPWNPQPE